jgi:hypothetical protein
MKKYLHLIFISICFIPLTLLAEEKTLISGKIESDGYGGPVLEVTSICGDGAVLFGGRGGWIINHTYAVGGGGYGLLNDVNINGNNLQLGYGGLELEYIGYSDMLVHFTVHTLIGYGGASYKELDENSDDFFIFLPALNAELNVTNWFRICGGVRYMLVSGIDELAGLNDKDLSGLGGGIVLKFGSF